MCLQGYKISWPSGVPWEGPSTRPLLCHLAGPTWGRPQHAWSQQGLGCFQICFHFQFPLLLNHLRATENKLLSSADLGFLASIVCSLLTLASDHFHPYPPPKGRHRPRIAAGKGGCRGCGQRSHSERSAACVRQLLLLPGFGGGVVCRHKPRAPAPGSALSPRPCTPRRSQALSTRGRLFPFLSPFKSKPG